MKRFIDIHIPVTQCNLFCHYCYVARGNQRNAQATKFLYSPQHIGKALSQERLGGVCHFNMCGLGETLIPEVVIDITREILEHGHYVMIVTNGTLTNRFEKFAEFPQDLKKRLGFKFSFHYLELKKRGMLETFYKNAEKVKSMGCSISIELTANDELEPYIEEVKKECMEHFGALCHITIPRDIAKSGFQLQSEHNIGEFYKIWSTFDSPMLDFKYSVWGQKRTEYCYAGAWSGLLNIGNGNFQACYGSHITQNIFENLEKPIDFVAVGHGCTLPHCYNSHSFLALGNIVEIDTCRYNRERNRINVNNNQTWLTPEMDAFLSQRLSESNQVFSEKEKAINSLKKAKYDIKYYSNKIEKKLKR